MNLEEVGKLFQVIVGFDNRHDPGESTLLSWHAGLDDDMTLGEATRAVIDHYAESREFVMVADVNERVRAAQMKQWQEDQNQGQRIAFQLYENPYMIMNLGTLGQLVREKGMGALAEFEAEQGLVRKPREIAS